MTAEDNFHSTFRMLTDFGARIMLSPVAIVSVWRKVVGSKCWIG